MCTIIKNLSYFSTKTYVVSTQNNHLNEGVGSWGWNVTDSAHSANKQMPISASNRFTFRYVQSESIKVDTESAVQWKSVTF